MCCGCYKAHLFRYNYCFWEVKWISQESNLGFQVVWPDSLPLDHYYPLYLFLFLCMYFPVFPFSTQGTVHYILQYVNTLLVPCIEFPYLPESFFVTLPALVTASGSISSYYISLHHLFIIIIFLVTMPPFFHTFFFLFFLYPLFFRYYFYYSDSHYTITTIIITTTFINPYLLLSLLLTHSYYYHILLTHSHYFHYYLRRAYV